MLSWLVPTASRGLISLRRRLVNLPRPPHAALPKAASGRDLTATAEPFLYAAGLLFGLAISLLMVARSQVAGDQLNLLARGWLLAFEGVSVPYGNPTSAGGQAPGTLTSLLTGLPLLLWQHHRAPTIVVWSTHLLAFLLLDRMLQPILSRQERLLFLFLYWLGPWRIYFSGFLWNPNYLFLVGAVHTWTAFRQRRRSSFALSLLHVLAIGGAAQLHASALILAVATGLLVRRRLLHLNLSGAALGALLIGLSLLPWLQSLTLGESSLVSDGTFLGRGLLLGFPLLKALLYWLRYPTSWISTDMRCFDLTALFGDGGGEAILVAGSQLVVVAVGVGLTAVGLLATRRLWRLARRHRELALDTRTSGRAWLVRYWRATLVAVVIVFALSPTTPSMWQLLIVQHITLVPLLLFIGGLLRTRHRRRILVALTGYVAICVSLLALMALGSPHYRCGGRPCEGRNATMPALASDHPMLDRLGIEATCPVEVNDPRGFWPDVLEKPEPPVPPNATQTGTEPTPRHRLSSD